MRSAYMLKKIVLMVLISSILYGCGSKHQENVAKLDEVYGVCDNPTRVLTKKEKIVVHIAECYSYIVTTHLGS